MIKNYMLKKQNNVFLHVLELGQKFTLIKLALKIVMGKLVEQKLIQMEILK